ncbi:unnamed protein product [Gulo gulo]|uniref:Uncharacterized protein n=1 Tax=Gulo gulo TaxID=48420 RepID=A0A9X9MCP0_GULGU|nr:unnamed protein product [Gulo gulo]
MTKTMPVTRMMMMAMMMTAIVHTGWAYSCVAVASVPGVLHMNFRYSSQ